MRNIMFICTGNICRSAMAHKMFEKLVEEKNKEVDVYSCGAFAEQGDIPTQEAINVMKEYGINLEKHKATNIKKSNIEDMDIILCATLEHRNLVIDMYPELESKTFTMKEYVGYPSNDLNIKDPWGFNIETYRRCAKEIQECLNKIIDKI